MVSTGVLRWRPTIESVLRSTALPARVPVELVLAIMAREVPNGDPRAYRREPDGRVSRGLMQVLEGTARELGLSDPQLLHVPVVGITYGVRYLASKLALYHGDVSRAVAAYNAGTARKTTSGLYVNQGYVSAVLDNLRTLGAAWGLPVLVIAIAALVAARRRAA